MRVEFTDEMLHFMEDGWFYKFGKSIEDGKVLYNARSSKVTSGPEGTPIVFSTCDYSHRSMLRCLYAIHEDIRHFYEHEETQIIHKNGEPSGSRANSPRREDEL